MAEIRKQNSDEGNTSMSLDMRLSTHLSNERAPQGSPSVWPLPTSLFALIETSDRDETRCKFDDQTSPFLNSQGEQAHPAMFQPSPRPLDDDDYEPR